MSRRMRRAAGFDAGFTLVELMMAVAILGVGFAFITQMFLGGYQLWKRSFDELMLQSSGRRAMALMTQALREAHPGTVQISTPGGMPVFSQIAFTDGRNRGWIIRQRIKGTDVVASSSVFSIEYVTTGVTGVTSTNFLADYVSAVSFTYPSFQNIRTIEVGLTMQRTPFREVPARAKGPVTVQLVEQVLLRNP